MKLVKYMGPGHVLKAGARTLYRGEPTPISEELYRRLAADPSNRLVVIEPPKPVKPAPPADEAASNTADQGEEESES